MGVAELHARACMREGLSWFPECPLFGGKNTLQNRFGTKDTVRCSEFRGGRFSEVANVLQVWDFQSVTRTLSILGSVSASQSVRSGRFTVVQLEFYIIFNRLIILKMREWQKTHFSVYKTQSFHHVQQALLNTY